MWQVSTEEEWQNFETNQESHLWYDIIINATIDVLCQRNIRRVRLLQFRSLSVMISVLPPYLISSFLEQDSLRDYIVYERGQNPSVHWRLFQILTLVKLVLKIHSIFTMRRCDLNYGKLLDILFGCKQTVSQFQSVHHDDHQPSLRKRGRSSPKSYHSALYENT